MLHNQHMSNSFKSLLIAFLTSLFCIGVWGGTPALNIELGSGNEAERKGKELIEKFSQQYDLSPYIFTKNILIKSKVIPHSHPLLTLNTRQINEPSRYLALFIHEQIHWFFNDPMRVQKTTNFIAQMKLKYPTVPSRKDGGADDAESTYLHFGVCYYEFVAMTKLIGEEETIKLFETADIYPWILQQVLKNRDYFGKALVESGLAWVDASSN